MEAGASPHPGWSADPNTLPFRLPWVEHTAKSVIDRSFPHNRHFHHALSISVLEVDWLLRHFSAPTNIERGPRQQPKERQSTTTPKFGPQRLPRVVILNTSEGIRDISFDGVNALPPLTRLSDDETQGHDRRFDRLCCPGEMRRRSPTPSRDQLAPCAELRPQRFSGSPTRAQWVANCASSPLSPPWESGRECSAPRSGGDLGYPCQRTNWSER